MSSVSVSNRSRNRDGRAPGSTAGRGGTGDPADTHTHTHTHVVQFYEQPEAILASAATFLGEGIEGGDSTIVIATLPHRLALESGLRARGLEKAIAEGRYVSLDADGTMDAFVRDGSLDSGRFVDVVGSAVSSAAAKASSGKVRAFEEMVALLCAHNNAKGAIELEKLWNGLLKTHPFTLLCGYPLELFRGETHAEAFAEICGNHHYVVPGESVPVKLDSVEGVRAIAALQQRAASLDTETGHRREAERKVLLREQELADFLENAAEGIHSVGPDGRILWANRAELELLGYRADEYIGRSIAEFHADGDVVGEILAKLTRGETLRDEPARLVCKDGTIKHVLIHSNVYREDGRFVHSRCFTRDVTDRVHLEEELRARILELAELDRRKDEFLAMLGHELRNPLSPVVTAVELARRRPEDASLVSRSLEVIERQTRHMTRLVDDLLDVSRITRGMIALRRETVVLTVVLDRAIEQVRPLIDKQGHQFHVKLPADPVQLHADPDRLEQIFVNLLSNAAKYTRIGGRITLEVRREETQAVVSVSDDGIGLAPELRERIFDLFVRGTDSGIHASGGLGVGLTLVRRLTEMHGGSVEARSDGRHCGSEFVVRLPIVPQRSFLGAVPADDRAPASLTAPGWRILVVDDNADAADGLAEYLRGMGHSVRAEYEGGSAVEEAQRSRPEIVVLDIGMPGLDGYEVARRLRRDVGLQSSLLVALSGYGQESDRRLSREAGFDHHLVKPIDLAKLETILKRPS